MTGAPSRPIVIIATENAAKLVEFRRLLPRMDVRGLDALEPFELPDETGETFVDNAIPKAVVTSLRAPHPVVADDSGLCVDQLGGRPGVRSARHGGHGLSDRQRYELVLAEMEGVPDPLRGAHYRAAIVLALEGRLISIHEGTCSGVLTHEARGSAGFGYDPIFLVPTFGLTMAQLTDGQKDAVSHRARAVAGLVAALADGVLGAS